jgi:ribonuclease Z
VTAPRLAPGARAAALALACLAACALDARIERRVTRSDRSLLESPALHVVFCGSGSGAPDPGRAGPCVAIVAAGRFYLIDVGAGAWETADLIGLPVESLRGVFLTKLLADDVADLDETITRSWLVGRAWRLPVYGPTGTRRVVDGVMAAREADTTLRLAHHDAAVLEPDVAGADAREFATPAGADPVVVLDEAGVRVTAFAVGGGGDASVGYRVDYRGRSVVVAGHSRGHPNVVAHARGADLLVHEATSHRMVEIGIEAMHRLRMERSGRLWQEMLRTHATPVEAAEAARRAGVKRLILSRIMPPLTGALDELIFLDGVRAVFPRCTLARDGMRIRLDPVD